MNADLAVSILTNTSATLEALEQLVEWADELQLAYAWVSSAKGTAGHWRALQLGKISRAVVGIQFANTEPHALRLLAEHPKALKVLEDVDGVFHPKVIVGLRETEAQAILGSSNLTVGGFSGNTELNVFLRGPRTRGPLAQIIEFIDAQWGSARAFHPDQDWLVRYSEAHADRPKPPRVRPGKGAPRVIVQSVSELNVSWGEYYTLISEQEGRTLANGDEIHVFDHPEGSFLQEVERCQQAFEQYPLFSTMPLEKRKLVAGWGGGSVGYFGRMRGAGYFKELTRVSPDLIGESLDQIPLSGEVSLLQAATYLRSITKLRGVSVGAATRLLTVKRPDLFLTRNGANTERLREIFGSAAYSVNGYKQLHKRIWEMPWFRSPEPDGVDQRRVWRARVALLDAVLYEKETKA